MSDVVVIETAPAEIVEVVAAGPQGPVGDVNPQMPVILAATEAARDAALVSELAAAASQSAAATSAANAATSESNAATSAATATAQATASAGSATDSAGSAAAAQASATNAATSETNAANSATASANSATSSANSATAAQAARTATESARDTTLATVGTMVLKANNLSDLASIPTALVNLGLNNVSNTSDANKPVSTATQAALNLKENAANKGVANGYAGLDAAGKVPANQLPSYVDDVLEFANLVAFPATGEAGKIYVALDTNKTYRWSGSTYIYITSGAVDSVAGKTGVVVLAKADVGLGSVDNTSDADKPVSTAQQAALNLKADAASPTTTGTLTHSGDIVLSGAGKRITGDFSNATVANRVMFQTSTASSATDIGAMPSGSAGRATLNLYSTADPNNAHVFSASSIYNSDIRLAASYTGTPSAGTYLPMTFYTGGSERVRIDTSGNVGIGTSSPSAANKLQVLSTVADNGVGIGGTTKQLRLSYDATGNYSQINSADWGTGQTDLSIGGLNLLFKTGIYSLVERARIDSSGNVGIGTTPSYKFDVRTNATGDIARFTNGIDATLVIGAPSGGVTYTQTNGGYQAWVIGTTERMRIDSSGNLLVGTKITDPRNFTSGSGYKLGDSFEFANSSAVNVINRTSSGSGIFVGFRVQANGTGSITTDGTSTAYNTSSDYRLKENIQPMQNALSTVAQLKPVTYTWKVDGSDGQGFIAHELQAVVPDCVTGEKDAVDADGNPVYQGIDTSFLVATLTAAIQELKAEFDAYKATHP